MLHPLSQWDNGGLTAVLYAYMDPSGTHVNSPVLSISGFVANEDAWRAFDKDWRNVLEKPTWPSRLSRFHMVDCSHCEGEFFEGRWRFAERLSLYGELVEVITSSDIRPVSASVVTNCFEQIPKEDLALLQQPENRIGTPLDMVFHMITQQIIKCVRQFDVNETVAVLLDQDDSAREAHFSMFASIYMNAYYLGETFAGHGFGDSRKYTPLQAADLLAYGTHHLVQIVEAMPNYGRPDFPVIPAFWGMLCDMSGRPLAPNGEGLNLKGLRDLVQKVKNKEFLPKPEHIERLKSTL
jgi:hypothetical protein